MIICPICGAQKKCLTKHVIMLHKITKEEFTRKYPGYKLIDDETSKKISDSSRRNWKNPEYAERCSSYWRSEVHAKKKSEELKARWDDSAERSRIKDAQHDGRMRPEVRERRAEIMKELSDKLWQDPDYVARRRISGRNQMLYNLDHNLMYAKPIKYGGTTYRSTWEVILAKFLDEQGLEFEYEAYRFPYVYEGIDRIYIPDFYIKSYNIFLEVKPEIFIDEIALVKYEAIPKTYRKAFVTEKQLFSEDIKLQLTEILEQS